MRTLRTKTVAPCPEGTTEVDPLERLYEANLPCGSEIHARGEWLHQPKAPASWLAVTRCGFRRYICDGGRRGILMYGETNCPGCRKVHPAMEVVFHAI